jgi:hypothetical protein
LATKELKQVQWRAVVADCTTLYGDEQVHQVILVGLLGVGRSEFCGGCLDVDGGESRTASKPMWQPKAPRKKRPKPSQTNLQPPRTGELSVSGGVKTDENRRFENPSGQMA